MKKLFFLLAFTMVSLNILKAQNCPGIAVYAYSDAITEGDTLIFTCKTENLTAIVKYNWTVSAGTIISGQGTARIYVSTTEAAGLFITASVTLDGLPEKCSTTASASSEVLPAAQLAVKGSFTNGEELKKAVQQFIAATSFKDSLNTGTAFIYLYKTTKTTTAAMNAFRQAINGAFEYNKILPHQYKIVEGGIKSRMMYEIYLLQGNGKEPKPSE